MKKTSRRLGYFFLFLLVVSVTGFVSIGDSQQRYAPQTLVQQQTSGGIPQLPDSDSTWFNAIFSALGGVGGCGLLLVFLIRRLVSVYDEKFSALDEKNDKIVSIIENVWKRWDTREEKLQDMLSELRGSTEELKIEIAKIQINSVDKESVTDAITRIALLEQNANGCIFLKKKPACGKDICNEV